MTVTPTPPVPPHASRPSAPGPESTRRTPGTPPATTPPAPPRDHQRSRTVTGPLVDPASARSPRPEEGTPRSRRISPASGPGPLPHTPAHPAAHKGPPGRRDQRRPGSHRPATPGASGRPSATALRAAAQRERERQPPYWFACRLLLVLSGQQPVHTMLRHARSAAYEQLMILAPAAPLRPRGRDRSTPALLEARGSSPRNGVIEAFARVATDGRQRAMAFRLEYSTQRRWLCSAIELDGLSGAPVRT